MNIAVFVVDNLSLESLYNSKAAYNVAWELDATVAPLLKSLGQEKCVKLYQTHKCFLRPWSIFYIPSKVFSVSLVTSGRHTANLYDLEQYYPDREPPESVEEIEQLGRELIEALAIMGIQPTKLTSPVAMWEQSVMNHLNLPTRWDIPSKAAEFAYRCSGKLWIECYQIGYWR